MQADASQIIKINAFANKHKLRVVEDAAMHLEVFKIKKNRKLWRYNLF